MNLKTIPATPNNRLDTTPCGMVRRGLTNARVLLYAIVLSLALPAWRASAQVAPKQDPKEQLQKKIDPSIAPKPDRPTRPEGPEITFESLIWELGVRDDFSYFPDPAFRLIETSSHDPASTSPSDASTWFSHDDTGNYGRDIEKDGRTEHILLDADGPGAVVRIFAENPTGRIRIYLDGSETPLIDEDASDFLSGRSVWKTPLCAQTAHGWNCNVPIPYSKNCLITYDGEPIAYEIDRRQYDADAPVITLTAEQMQKHDRLLKALGRGIVAARSPQAGNNGGMDNEKKVVPAGESKLIWSSEKPGIILQLGLNVEAQDGNLEVALRGLVLRIEFDGRETVYCPVSDFFGAAPGFSEYSSWRIVNDQTKWMQARWFMPYSESAQITLDNLSPTSARVRYSIIHREDYKWNDRSMYFHADWRIGDRMTARPERDWNVIEINGKGVFLGDALNVTNPSRAWWGQGDPKIFVDGETTPSTLGTGMDHYYGFGKASSRPFNTPFHSRPRCDGPGHYGQTSLNRFRGLDAVPFNKSFKLDFGLHHTDENTTFSYAATVFWYALGDATTNIQPASAQTLQDLPSVRPIEPSFVLDDVIEGESLAVVKSRPKFDIGPQHLWREGLFSQDLQMFGNAQQAGSRADLAIPVDGPGTYHLTAYMTKGPSYGMTMFWVDDTETGIAIDFFNEHDPFDIEPYGPVDLGEYEVLPEQEDILLGFESIGTNGNSEFPYYSWGLDAVRVEKVDQ